MLETQLITQFYPIGLIFVHFLPKKNASIPKCPVAKNDQDGTSAFSYLTARVVRKGG